MIATITCNPSLDYHLHAGCVRMGETNRSDSERLVCGGKGINVAIVLKRLGREVCAYGFVGGFVGEEIERQVRALGVSTEFLRLSNGVSRINVKLHAGEETEFNARGPAVSQGEWDKLLAAVCSSGAEFAVLAGNPAPGLPSACYAEAVRRLQERGIRVALDASEEPFRLAVLSRPYLVKPNRAELSEWAGRPLVSREDCLAAARALQQAGCRNVIISLGGEGALFVPERGKALSVRAPAGKVVDTVGAGDSVVAGFLAAVSAGEDLREAFCLGIAAGSATAFSEELCRREEAERILAQLIAEEADGGSAG